jgi:hypothetical protein
VHDNRRSSRTCAVDAVDPHQGGDHRCIKYTKKREGRSGMHVHDNRTSREASVMHAQLILINADDGETGEKGGTKRWMHVHTITVRSSNCGM